MKENDLTENQVYEGELVDNKDPSGSLWKKIFLQLIKKFWFWVVLIILVIILILGFIIFGTVFFYQKVQFVIFSVPWNPYLMAVAVAWILTGIFKRRLKILLGKNLWWVRRLLIIIFLIWSFIHYGYLNGVFFFSTVFIIRAIILALLKAFKIKL